MKRLKSELINATIESYLKRRHYQAGYILIFTSIILFKFKLESINMT